MRLLGVVVAALIWPVLAWAGTATAADSDRPRHVLLLYAESRLLPGIVEGDTAFRSTVTSSPGAPVVFHTEFLDLPPAPSAAYEHRLRDLLRVKYQDVHLDLIMAFASRALRIALDHRDELGPSVPIVFVAVDSPGDLALPRDVTGVQMMISMMDTLEAALRLQPETRSVVVVAGTSGLDQRWVAAARVAFADAPAHLEFATFASAEEFLASNSSRATACLVLDVHLGGMSGFDLQERLAAAGIPIPTIFITALDDPITRERARSGVAFLRKPFREDALIGAIQQALEPRGA